jgi:uncharacterized protein YdhG (YjbR/CyaY superfamily)
MTIKKEINSVEEYIQQFPKDIQDILENVRKIINSVIPDAEEAMSYQIPTIKFHGNLVHFAAFKNHIGFYPTPSGIEAFKKELSSYQTAKGSVKFPIDKPIPFDLIRRIVLFRVKENSQKKIK